MARPARSVILQTPPPPGTPAPAAASTELPLDHEACIVANLRHAHAQSGSAVPFEVAIKNNLVRRCLENAVTARQRARRA